MVGRSRREGATMPATRGRGFWGVCCTPGLGQIKSAWLGGGPRYRHVGTLGRAIAFISGWLLGEC